MHVQENVRAVNISSDGGRVCRPLIIVREGVPQITEAHVREIVEKIRTFDDLLREGLVEYLDVNEENNSLIALYEASVTPDHTHVEIDP